MTKIEQILLRVRESDQLIREVGECEKQPNCTNCKMSKTCLRLCQLQLQLHFDIAQIVDKS